MLSLADSCSELDKKYFSLFCVEATAIVINTCRHFMQNVATGRQTFL